MSKKTIEDIQVAGKKVLVRVDFNVPMDKEGNITDDNRIRGALPTIQYLVDHKARVILCSHLGRPKGEFNMKYSVKAAAARLAELLGQPVPVAADVIGDSAKSMAAALKDGEVMMIENVRFHKEEEANDPTFAKELASMAEIYVNDAFGTAHRAHASTAGVAAYLPAVSGYLIAKELDVMGKALENPDRPFVAILGGAKVKDKLGVITNLLNKVDTLIIGGGMSYTFQYAMGGTIGNSLFDPDRVEFCKEKIAEAKAKGVRLLLPVDNVITQEFSNEAASQVVPGNAIPDGWEGMDIGPETQKLFAEAIKGAKTVVFRGGGRAAGLCR